MSQIYPHDIDQSMAAEKIEPTFLVLILKDLLKSMPLETTLEKREEKYNTN